MRRASVRGHRLAAASFGLHGLRGSSLGGGTESRRRHLQQRWRPTPRQRRTARLPETLSLKSSMSARASPKAANPFEVGTGTRQSETFNSFVRCRPSVQLGGLRLTALVTRRGTGASRPTPSRLCWWSGLCRFYYHGPASRTPEDPKGLQPFTSFPEASPKCRAQGPATTMQTLKPQKSPATTVGRRKTKQANTEETRHLGAT